MTDQYERTVRVRDGRVPDSVAPPSAAGAVTVESGDEPRPDFGVVFWVGGADRPTNMAAQDVWLQAPPDTTPTDPPPDDAVSVFGADPPPGTYSLYDDGSNLQIATLFYGTAAYRVLGGRVWLPTIPEAAGDLHVWAVPAQGGGTLGPMLPAWADMPAQAAGAGVIPSANLAQGWNEVTFPNPVDMGPRITPFETGSAIWVGYHFGAGQHYIHSPGSSIPDSVRPAGNEWLTHPEQIPNWGLGTENRRAGNSAAGGGWTNTVYGIDILAEAA